MQKVVEFVKIVYAFPRLVPVIVKPMGAAAQIGVPEAFRVSLKAGRPLIVVPEIRDISVLLGAKEVYYYDSEGDEIDPEGIGSRPGQAFAIVFSSGESEPGKNELVGAKIIRAKGLSPLLPPLALISIFLYRAFGGYQTT